MKNTFDPQYEVATKIKLMTGFAPSNKEVDSFIKDLNIKDIHDLNMITFGATSYSGLIKIFPKVHKLDINLEIQHLSLGYKAEEIITLAKDDIYLDVSCLKPHIGAVEEDDFKIRAILKLLRDGWSAIPF